MSEIAVQHKKNATERGGSKSMVIKKRAKTVRKTIQTVKGMSK